MTIPRRFFDWLMACHLFECVTTFVMLSMAVTIIALPATIQRGDYRYMLVDGFTPFVPGLFFAVVGVVRVVAFYGNGNWPLWGPRLRALGAAGGAFAWFWICTSLGYLTIVTGTLPLEIFVWFGLTAGEILSMARAGADVRTKPGH